MKFEYVSIDSLGENTIILVGRNGEKRKVFIIKDFYPYFYVPINEIEKLKDKSDVISIHVEEMKIGLDGSKLVKIVVKDRSVVPKLRKYFERTYESDIPFYKRAKIDMGIKSGFEIDDEKANLEVVSWKDVKGF